MTGETGGVRMRSSESEFGGVVIELGCLPVIGVMTAGAVGAQRIVVHVCRLVAADALRRRLGVAAVRLMAGDTALRFMAAD